MVEVGAGGPVAVPVVVVEGVGLLGAGVVCEDYSRSLGGIEGVDGSGDGMGKVLEWRNLGCCER